ncbi:hypothetical protein N7504_004127 [Penicillium tannophilum]|nr:hypothetical protein N7504_004127 [Penicillium tannophilum]
MATSLPNNSVQYTPGYTNKSLFLAFRSSLARAGLKYNKSPSPSPSSSPIQLYRVPRQGSELGEASVCAQWGPPAEWSWGASKFGNVGEVTYRA